MHELYGDDGDADDEIEYYCCSRLTSVESDRYWRWVKGYVGWKSTVQNSLWLDIGDALPYADNRLTDRGRQIDKLSEWVSELSSSSSTTSSSSSSHLSIEDAWEAVPEADGFLVEELLLRWAYSQSRPRYSVESTSRSLTYLPHLYWPPRKWGSARHLSR